jgi:hypothetical protein
MDETRVPAAPLPPVSRSRLEMRQMATPANTERPTRLSTSLIDLVLDEALLPIDHAAVWGLTSAFARIV